MKHKSALFCGTCGILFCIIACFVGYLPYMSLNSAQEQTLLSASMLVGWGISASVIMYKNTSIKHALIRTLILKGSFVFGAIFGIWLEIPRLINTILKIEFSDAPGEPFGVVIAIFLWIDFGVCIIANAIVGMVNIRRHWRNE